jgi:hypothetical protein
LLNGVIYWLCPEGGDFSAMKDFGVRFGFEPQTNVWMTFEDII